MTALLCIFFLDRCSAVVVVHMLKKVLLASSALSGAVARSFDWTMANITLNHCMNTYCDPPTYEDRNYDGYLEGFVPSYTIYDEKHDTHGLMGYHSGQENIYVTFRGSVSLKNWIDDLDAVTVAYPLCDKCKVHKGFFDAAESCYLDILSQVQKLQAEFPTYSVVVSGHSLGGALSLHTALSLIYSGVNNVQLWNYGCPRVGNTEFATYASENLNEHYRVTHHKDMVVHTPMHERFTHIDGEWYQPGDDAHVEECTGFEDPKCSYQWHFTSVSDHEFYLGMHVGASDPSWCDNFLDR